MRRNFNSSESPHKEISDFYTQCISAGHRVFWDKAAQGIVLIAEPQKSDHGTRYSDPRYFEVKTRNDLDEVFHNYDDIE